MTAKAAARTLLAAAALAAAAPAAGQAPEVSFDAGRVTITAREAPLAAILDAWARQGDSRFVGAGRLAERAVSVQLVDVPEREALRVLLRLADGYVALPRASGQAGASAFDRVFIMAGSGRPRTARQTPAAQPAPGADGATASGPGPAEPPATGTPAAEPVAAEAADALDDMDNLALVESLRRRIRSAATPTADTEPAAFRSRPDGGDLPGAARPGMVIEADEPSDRPNPARRRAP